MFGLLILVPTLPLGSSVVAGKYILFPLEKLEMSHRWDGRYHTGGIEVRVVVWTIFMCQYD